MYYDVGQLSYTNLKAQTCTSAEIQRRNYKVFTHLRSNQRDLWSTSALFPTQNTLGSAICITKSPGNTPDTLLHRPDAMIEATELFTLIKQRDQAHVRKLASFGRLLRSVFRIRDCQEEARNDAWWRRNVGNRDLWEKEIERRLAGYAKPVTATQVDIAGAKILAGFLVGGSATTCG